VGEDSEWHEWATWIRLGASVVTAVIAGRMIDRYGWGDGLVRGVAIAWLIDVAVYVGWAGWLKHRSLTRAFLVAGTLGSVLYLAATFGLGERGPGGTLCVAALVLIVVSGAGLGVRASAST
jgi:hypothetical protein